MGDTHEELRNVSKALEHAVDALSAAASRVDVPAPLRAQVVAALVAVARVAGLAEALAEGVAVLTSD